MLVGLLHRKVHTIETGRLGFSCTAIIKTRLDRPSFVCAFASILLVNAGRAGRMCTVEVVGVVLDS